MSAVLSTYSRDWKNEHRAADGHLHYFLLHRCESEDVGDNAEEGFLAQLKSTLSLY